MLTKRLQFVILWMLAGTVLTGAVWLMSANQTIDYARDTGGYAINWNAVIFNAGELM